MSAMRSLMAVGIIAAVVVPVGRATAEGIPLPSCQDATDGAWVELYDVHQNRYVSALRMPAVGEGTTLLLDCATGVGYEIMDDGSSPDIVEADGSRSPPSLRHPDPG
jgi:hypothetical protein